MHCHWLILICTSLNPISKHTCAVIHLHAYTHTLTARRAMSRIPAFSSWKRRVEEKRLVIREEECRQWLWKQRGESPPRRAAHLIICRAALSARGSRWRTRVIGLMRGFCCAGEAAWPLPAVRKIITHTAFPHTTHTRVFQSMKGHWFRDAGIKSSSAYCFSGLIVSFLMLKGKSTQKWKCCQLFLTLMSIQTCMTDFFSVKKKRRDF